MVGLGSVLLLSYRLGKGLKAQARESLESLELVSVEFCMAT